MNTYPQTSSNHEASIQLLVRDRYDPNTALQLAKYSKLAYKSKREIAIQLNQDGFEKLFYFDVKGTQAFLAIHPGNGSPFSVLAFRGTEKDYLDLLTDILILKRKLPDIQEDVKECESGHTLPERKRYFAHGGFLEALQSVWGSALSREIEAAMGNAKWIGNRGISEVICEELVTQSIPLFVTGHSLGGALATLASYHALAYHSDVYLYTFGSPRVANRELAEHISKRLDGRIYRCVNQLDIVPRIPFSFNYHHVCQVTGLFHSKETL